MNRRNFLGAGLLAPAAATLGMASLLGAPSAQAATGRPLSYAAKQGFLPNVPLVTHTGEHVNFYDDLVQDRIIVLNFFVVACSEGRCAIANANLRKVQDMLGDRMGKDVWFYSVSLQPEQDTVPILREYAEDIFDVKPGWLFLTGKPSDIETLRRAQGFYDPDPERDADVTLHAASARVGSDYKQRWNMVALSTSPKNIYTNIITL
jgi:protein SCO1/2